MWQLQLLGPLRLLHDGRPLLLTIRKVLALLGLLAGLGRLERSRLVFMLWPGQDEATGRRNLRRELARLRDLGVGDILVVEGDFIAIAPQVECDFETFERHLRDGRPDEALMLWRGEPLQGLVLDDCADFEEWLAALRHRLTGLHRLALEASARSREAGGDAQGALTRVEALLAHDPLQEQHHVSAMRLLAALGRREAALAQYEHCRAMLRSELGLDPMDATQALARVLRSASALQASEVTEAPPGSTPGPRVTVQLPIQPPFVGRSAAVAFLEDAWRKGHAVLIEGEAGVGKTRLVENFAASHGAYALARCRPGDAEVPYASFSRALRALAGGNPAPEDLPSWALGELARLLPEWGAAPPPIRTAEERNRFFEACAQGWQALSVGNFDAILLDDWHLADASSHALLTYVAQRRREMSPHGTRELVLLRPDLPESTLQQLRDGLQARTVVLEPLRGDEVLELIQRLSGVGQPVRFAARLLQATAGNPFFLVETLRHLAEQGLLSAGQDGVWHTPFDDDTEDYGELPVPASVRDAVLARVQRLPEACRRILEAAALATEPFLPAFLAPACALSELQAVLTIEQAVQARLLREHGSGGFAFAHDLIQQALDGALPQERRRLVHRRLALGAEGAAANPAVVAWHHEASGDSARAVAFRLAAAEQAHHLQAWPEAIQQWQKALSDGATPSQALRAHQGLMQVTQLRCEFDDMLAHGASLQALVAQAPASLLAPEERAGALISVADNLAFSNRADQALGLLNQLPEHLPEPLQGRMLIVRTRVLQALGRIEEALAAARAAMALQGLPTGARIDLLDSLTRAEFAAGNMQLARAHADAGLSLGQATGDEAGAARAVLRRGLIYLAGGDLEAAESELMLAAARCANRGDVNLQRMALYNLCLVYEAQSRHAQALVTAQQGWNLQPALQRSAIRVMYRLAFVDSHNALGQLGAAWENARIVIDEVLDQREPFILLAATACTLEMLGLLGEVGLARQLLAAADLDSVRELRTASPELWVAQAQFELGLGDAVAARHALTLAQPEQIVDPRVLARHALAWAELSLAEGDALACLALLPADDAASMNDEMRMRSLALRLRAEACTGSVHTKSVQRALTLLAAESPYAPATLQLHRALCAAQAAGVRNVPADATAQARQWIVELASSLNAYPQQQEFLSRALA